MSKKIICEMNRFECPSKNEVIYLVPCVKKLTASLLNCSSNTLNTKVLNICQTKEGAVNIPSTLLKELSSFGNEIKSCQNVGSKNLAEFDNHNCGYSVEADSSSELPTNECLPPATKSEHFANTVASPDSQNFSFITNTNYLVTVGNCKPDQFSFQETEVPLLHSVQEQVYRMSAEPEDSMCTSVTDKADDIIHNEVFSRTKYVSSEEFEASPVSESHDMPGDTCSESDINIQDTVVQAHQSAQLYSPLQGDVKHTFNTSKPVEMDFAGSPGDCLFTSSSVIPPLCNTDECHDRSLRYNSTESFQERDIKSSSNCDELLSKEGTSDMFDADFIVKDLFSCDMTEKNNEKKNLSLGEPSDRNISEMSEFEALLLSPVGVEIPSTSGKTLDKALTATEDIVEGKFADPSYFAVKQQPPGVSCDGDDMFAIDSIISDVGNILDEYQVNGSPFSVIAVNSVQKDFSPATSFKDPSSCDKISDNMSLAYFSGVDSCKRPLKNHNAGEGKVRIKNGNVSAPSQDHIPVVDNALKFCDSEKLFDELLKPEEKYARTSETLNRLFSGNSCHETTPIPSSSSAVIKSNPPKTGLEIPGIPTKVAFKVRPAGKPGKYHDRGRTLDKSAQNMSKVSVGGRNRKAKSYFSYRLLDDKCVKGDSSRFTWEVEKTNVRKCDDCGESSFSSMFSYKKHLPQSCSEFSPNDPQVGSSTAKQDVSDFIEPNVNSDRSITIPNTMQTNVISFKPNVTNVYKASDRSSSVISYNQDNFASKIVSSSPNIQLTPSGPSTSSSAMQYSYPDVRNINLPVTSASATTVSLPLDSATPVKSSFITLRKGSLANYGVAFPQTTPCKPLCMMTPTASCSQNKKVITKSIPVCNLMTASDNVKNKACSISQSAHVENPNSVTCQQVKIDVHQVASKMPNIHQALSARDSTASEGKLPEPIKITIRTKPVDLPAVSEKASAVNTKEENLVQKQGLSTDVNRSSHVSVSDLKSSQDSFKKIPSNKNWSHELKVHFPNVPESILQQLTIPPQALHRGYLTTNDLQNIRTQALKLHLGIIYRNHVSKCTTCRCEICHTFVVQQGSLSWTAREKLFKMNKKQGKSAKSGQSKFKAKKRGRRCSRNRLPNGEEDDPTYEPPLSYFNAWKRKSSNTWYNNCQVKMPRAENNFGAGNMPECYVLLNNIWQVENNNKKNCTFTRQPVPKYNSCQTEDKFVSKYNMQSGENTVVEQNIQCQLSNEKSAALPVPKDVIKIEQNNKDIQADLQSSKSSEDTCLGMLSADTSLPEFDAGGYISGFSQEWQNPYPNLDSYACTVTKEENAFNTDNTTSGIAYYTPTSSIESQTVLHSHLLNDTLPISPTLYLEEGCTCSGSCRIMECPCARAGVICHARQCSCNTCDNPLNTLLEFKLDVHTARLDECLMQNLYRYNTDELRKLLSSDITVPCCRAVVKLQHIIPSTVICNCCGSAVSYSWCMHSIHLQNVLPRNHCLVCCSCKPSFHTHCQVCKLCTPSVNQSTCSECGTAKFFAV